MGSWQEELQKAIRKSRGVKPKDRIYVMSYVECIYSIWLNRNRAVFDATCGCIDATVRSILFRVITRSKEEWKQVVRGLNG